VDLAYRLRLNEWNGKQSVELEVIGIRAASPSVDRQKATALNDQESDSKDSSTEALWTTQPIAFHYGDRQYWSSMSCHGDEKELRIRNPEGKVLAIQPSQKKGVVGDSRDSAEAIDFFEPHYFNLIQAAMEALRSQQTTIP
jgi:single-stranded-DNA-specific exonuclease